MGDTRLPGTESRVPRDQRDVIPERPDELLHQLLRLTDPNPNRLRPLEKDVIPERPDGPPPEGDEIPERPDEVLHQLPPLSEANPNRARPLEKDKIPERPDEVLHRYESEPHKAIGR